ncbi:hypothetical protein BC831DRAFT_442497, partial [Entophlyctis helioformis]
PMARRCACNRSERQSKQHCQRAGNASASQCHACPPVPLRQSLSRSQPTPLLQRPPAY